LCVVLYDDYDLSDAGALDLLNNLMDPFALHERIDKQPDAQWQPCA